MLVLHRAQALERLRAAAVDERGRVDRALLRLRDDLEETAEVADLLVRVILSLDVVPLPGAVQAADDAEVGAVADAGAGRDELVREHVVQEHRGDRDLGEVVLRVRLGNRGTVDARASRTDRVDDGRDHDGLAFELAQAHVAERGRLLLGVVRDVLHDVAAELVAVLHHHPLAEGVRGDVEALDEGRGVRLDVVLALLLVAADVLVEVIRADSEGIDLRAADRRDVRVGRNALKLATQDLQRVEVDRLHVDARVDDEERMAAGEAAVRDEGLVVRRRPRGVRDDLAERLVDVARGARAAVLLAHHVAAARLDRELDEVVAVPDVLDGDAEPRTLVDDPAELLEGARDELEHVDAEGIRPPRGLHAGPAHLLPGVVVRPVLHRTARILDARVGLERFPVAETGVDLKAAAEDVRLVHEPVEELERATRDAVDPLVRVLEDVLLDEGVERLRRGHEHLVVLEDLIAFAAAVPVLGRVGRAVIGVHPRTHVLTAAAVLRGRAVEQATLA